MRILVISTFFLLSRLTAIAQFSDKLMCSLEEIARELNIRVVLNIEAPNDSWNSVTFSDATLNEATTLRYLTTLRREYLKYPRDYLAKAGAHTIILGNDLKFKDQPRAGVPDPYRKQLFLSMNGAFGISSERYLVHVMHHELHHCTEYSIWKKMTFDWPDWMCLNEEGFCYGEGGASAYPEYISKKTDFYTPTNPRKGFINLYSLTGDEEDRAELLAFIMSDHERPIIKNFCMKDEVLHKKTQLLLKLIVENTHHQFTFPEWLTPP